MARITVEDCLKKVDNQYDLVLLAKERTSQINSGSPMLVKEDNDKSTVISLREIAEGKVDTKDLKSNAILRLRKEPDETVGEEEQEEITNDNFESQYKGEVSKSGVAILPSKRARKMSTQTPSSSESQETEKKKESLSDKPLNLTEEVKDLTEDSKEPQEEIKDLEESKEEKNNWRLIEKFVLLPWWIVRIDMRDTFCVY